MTDTTNASPRLAPTLPVEMIDAMRRRGMAAFSLTLAEARQLTSHMRRLSLAVHGDDAFEPKPGQDMVFMLPDETGELNRRHYSVRGFDRAARRIEVDVVLHGGSTPGTRWALDSKAGDAVTAFGPRGRNVIQHGADWRLFIGDETTLPPIFAMLETLQAGEKAHVILEVGDEGERQSVTTAGDVTFQWIFRGGRHAEASSPALIEALAGYEFPAGRGHIYLLGETSTIRRQRHDLLARGVAKEQIFGEGYWRPGRLGGHDHLEER